MRLFILLSLPLLHMIAEEDDGDIGNAIIDVFRTSGSVSYEKEWTMGQTIALQAFETVGKLSSDRSLLEYVSMVGNTVARASDRPHTPYFFAVCENPDPNAFAVPGGFIFMTTGLLKLVKNEEELAGILGHEIAHISLQHAIKGIKSSKRWGAGLKLGGLVLNTFLNDEGAGETPSNAPLNYGSLIGMGFQQITETGHGYKHEIDADEAGIEYAYRAGYRATGLRDFLQTLATLEKGKEKFALFKTHRDHRKRVKALDKFLKKEGFQDLGHNTALVGRFNANLKSRINQ
jgi:predicted Zn-dependent protease